MNVEEVKSTVGKRLAWVGAASSAVALLDILALILILKFWVSPEVYGIATVVVTLFGALELAAEDRLQELLEEGGIATAEQADRVRPPIVARAAGIDPGAVRGRRGQQHHHQVPHQRVVHDAGDDQQDHGDAGNRGIEPLGLRFQAHAAAMAQPAPAAAPPTASHR